MYGHWCVKIKEITVGKRVLQCTSRRPVVAYNLITVVLYIFLLNCKEIQGKNNICNYMSTNKRSELLLLFMIPYLYKPQFIS